MSTQQPTHTESRSPYWGVPIARAIPAFVIAAITTFNPNHSSQGGLLLFGVYAVVSGLMVAGFAPRYVADRVNRRLFIVSGVTGVVLGAAALAFNGGGFALFLFIVSLFGALTGFIELYCGLRTRSAVAIADRAPAKDWLAVGAFTALLALVFLVVPLDVVTAVGLLGGYAVIVGIFLVIGGLSLRSPGTAADAAPFATQIPNPQIPNPQIPNLKTPNPQTPETTL